MNRYDTCRAFPFFSLRSIDFHTRTKREEKIYKAERLLRVDYVREAYVAVLKTMTKQQFVSEVRSITIFHLLF